MMYLTPRRADTQRVSSPTGPAGHHLLALQRAAGNRAVAAAFGPASVQRCGGEVHAGCSCAETGPESGAQTGEVTAQRLEDSAPGTSGDDAPTAPTELGPSGPPTAAAFSDSFSPRTVEVPIAVRQNAADFQNNLMTKMGGDGGHTTASLVGGSVTTTLDDKGNVSGAALNWNIVEQVPTVAPDPNGPISAPAAAAELAAAQALAARVRQHEDGHATREQSGRTGFAKSLKGIKDAAVDGALKGLECRVGATQRAFDNQEGHISLTAGNTIAVSGTDHPEYVQGC